MALTRRRKFQNRMAQRKRRERMKAQQRDSFCEGQVGNMIADASADTAHPNELAFSTLDQMLRDLNIPGSVNEAQDDSSTQQIESLNGQFLSSPDDFLQKHQGCKPYMNNDSNINQRRETAILVQSQRARICDQAERLLEKVMTLYDCGVSLDILAADPNLRMLLVNASTNFNAQRSVESHGAETADFREKRWVMF
ncbi:hypothetical protein DPV78_005065 [Talaromyces pinophilus]|nr:hypothetical protein DPV78_005065 [Talaromyces pinophilus]